MTEKRKRRLFIFIDTNLVYTKGIDYNIFQSNFLTQMIKLRDFFSKRIKTTQIFLIFPNTIIRERHKQKLDLLFNKIDEIIKQLRSLKKNRVFNADATVSKLEKERDTLEEKIEETGYNFLEEKSILITQGCSPDYFERIKNKAYRKEKPFDNKDADGFKDALIWYEIIDYVNTQGVSDEDHIFLFTNNSRDFKSDSTLAEFKTLVHKEINIISRQPDTFQICSSENQEFLKFTLKEAKGIEITEILIEYTEHPENVSIERLLANPFPIDLSSITISYRLKIEDWQKVVEKRTIDLLKSFNFKIEPKKIRFQYSQLPNIVDICVFLDFHEEGMYYDINYFEILFENDETKEIELKNENYLILDDYIIDYQAPDFTFFRINSHVNDQIALILENLVNRHIDPDLLTYTLLH